MMEYRYNPFTKLFTPKIWGIMPGFYGFYNKPVGGAPTPIDVGPGATNRATSQSIIGLTLLDLANASNNNGYLDTVEIWMNIAATFAKIGTLSGSIPNFTVRDSVDIGPVSAGSKQTFSDLALEIQSGDYLGIYGITAGTIETDTSGGSGVEYIAADKMIAIGSSGVYSALASYAISLYGSGYTGNIVNMGSGAVNRATTQSSGLTFIDLRNPINANGTITTVNIWCNTALSGLKVGVATDDGGGNFTCSNAASIGAVTAGSKQQFTGLSISAIAGQYLAMYWSGGAMELDTSGGAGCRYLAGDQFGAGSQAFTLGSGWAISAYGFARG